MKKDFTFPRFITLDGRTIANPTPEQCRQAGYDVYSSEDISRLRQQQDDLAQAVAVLRSTYVSTVHQIAIALGAVGDDGLPTYEKFSDGFDVYRLIATAPPEHQLGLTQLSLVLYMTIQELRRLDGDDAWDRIEGRVYQPGGSATL